MLRLLCLLTILVGGCSLGPNNLQTNASQDLDGRGIKRIAVLAAELTSDGRTRVPFTAETNDPRGNVRDAPELFSRLLYTTMTGMTQWQIVSESEMREADGGVSVGSDAALARQLGEKVYADAVMSGTVLRFRQRVGDDWGAQSPASVAFVLNLLDVRRGDIVWTARFDETQKSLTENFWGVFQVGERGLRWLSAEELTAEGLKKAIGRLHQILFKNPN
jgi:hypothetical protein